MDGARESLAERAIYDVYWPLLSCARISLKHPTAVSTLIHTVRRLAGRAEPAETNLEDARLSGESRQSCNTPLTNEGLSFGHIAQDKLTPV